MDPVTEDQRTAVSTAWEHEEFALAYDYIVVGAGSAGSALTYRLSASPSKRVLVVEAGQWDRHPFIHLSVGLSRLPGSLDWGYRAEPDDSLGGRVDLWAAGKVTGGGSSVNGMAWVRGAPGDFDEWEKLGCPGWSYRDVLPYFRRSETYEGGDDHWRGGNGPQHVARGHSPHPLNDAFLTAAEQAGLPYNPDYNGERQLGASYAQLSQRRGLRWSTARGYLARARRRPNCTVLTGCEVTRVLVEKGRAVGVEVAQGGRVRQIRCTSEVVLSAGAIATPKLLMLSGIGPADHLRSLGITPLLDAPGVGQNLMEHSCMPLTYAVDIRSPNQEVGPAGFVRHGLDFVLRGRGAATAAPAQAMLFGSLDASGSRTDFEVMFAPFSVAAKEGGDDPRKQVLAKSAVARALVSHVRPRGRGTVTLRSSRFSDTPLITRPLYCDPQDAADMVQAVRFTRDVLRQPGFARHVVAEISPGDAVRSDDELHAAISKMSYGGQHASGTCRMGTDTEAVVDPQLRVRGVAGLRVVDASIMPRVTSGNTNAPTIMIGERGSDLILTGGSTGTKS